MKATTNKDGLSLQLTKEEAQILNSVLKENVQRTYYNNGKKFYVWDEEATKLMLALGFACCSL